MKFKKFFISSAFFLGASLFVSAQTVTVEGYAYKEGNRGYLKNTKIVIIGADDKQVYVDTLTNKDGFFSADLPADKDFLLVADKKRFFQKQETFNTKAAKNNKVYLKIEMERKPGYVFDVTLAEADDGLLIKEGIQGARIEVYNNTTASEELVLNAYPYPNFKFTFELGNHYTIMIRKKDFFTKRVEAYVNVEGCILCFEGLSIVEVTDVMTDGNSQGTFLANVELVRAEMNTTFEIENIYYDYDKYFIRPDAAVELDRLVTVLKDNPQITVEMGSHTDSRGRDAYNMSLSQKRAKAAYEYLLNQGVEGGSLTYRGYGETNLINACANGIACSEKAHQENRRTELKIVGIRAEDPMDKKSLKDIIEEETLMFEVMNSPIIRGENFISESKANSSN